MKSRFGEFLLSGRIRPAAVTCVLAGLALASSGWAVDRTLVQQSSPAVRVGGVSLASAVETLNQEVGLTCFEDSLTLVLNPGCFSPPASGDCVTQTTHYFVQYITPAFTEPHRITEMAFVSNDAATIFPRAGVVLIPTVDNRFPTGQELDSLQVANVKAAQDLSEVVVDLRSENLVVTADTDVVVCLRFPAGQQLTNVGVGPGIVVDEVNPDQNCDFFTVDKGAAWFRPAEGDPLDWGFAVFFEPVSAIESKSWTAVKRLFGGERPVLYSSP